MFEFDRTREEQEAEIERWDGIERRRAENAEMRLAYDQICPQRFAGEQSFPQITICDWCRRHIKSHGQLGICPECRAKFDSYQTNTAPDIYERPRVPAMTGLRNALLVSFAIGFTVIAAVSIAVHYIQH